MVKNFKNIRTDKRTNGHNSKSLTGQCLTVSKIQSVSTSFIRFIGIYEAVHLKFICFDRRRLFL